MAVDHGLYWRRSLISAVSAQVLGVEKGLTSLEQLFLSGLLQDVGILALDKVMPGKYGDLFAQAENYWELIEIEKQALSSSHDEVGAWLLRHWSFPEIISSSVECSHKLMGGKIDGDEDCFSTLRLPFRLSG